MRLRRRAARHSTRVAAAVASVAAVAALASAAGAHADSTRAYAGPAGAVPHVTVAIADTGDAARGPRAARPPYVAGRRYTAPGCAPGRVYWRRGGGAPPPCTSSQWVDRVGASSATGLRCDAAAGELARRGWHAVGALRSWDAAARQWGPPVPGEHGALACAADRGRGGPFPADGEHAPWSADPRAEIAWDEHPDGYTLYDVAYVAWWHGSRATRTAPWADAQAAAIVEAAVATDGPFALLRHSWNGHGPADADAEGGMVVLGAASGRAAPGLAALLGSAPLGGGSPLAETLDEAARYLAAREVRYGLASHAAPGRPQPSAVAVRTGALRGLYASPVAHACSRAAVFAFAAGAPGQDAGALGAPWPGGSIGACRSAVPGDCAARFGAALAGSDVAPLPGVQSARVEWWLPAPRPAWLAALAPVRAVPIEPDALASHAVAAAVAHGSAPGVAAPVDARARLAAHARGAGAADGAYAAYVVPGSDDRWRGALHRLQVDATGALQASRAAHPAPPATRRVWTDLSGPRLAAPGNAVVASNPTIAASALGLEDADPVARERLIAWARGADVDDVDADGDRAEARGDLGALLGAPAVVRYVDGRTIVYAGSGDGYLHAFEGGTREAWAYVPRAFLARLAALVDGPPTGRRRAGVDGDVRVLLDDRDADGRVDATRRERAVLLVGLRRGGRAYLALDVTAPDDPRLLWTLGPRELPGLGQTWAAPVPARLTIAGVAQNADRRVVLLAGGHDPAQDRPTPRARDRIGAALYLVDAYSGALLWWAGGPGSGADLVVPDLVHAIAATPRALDLDDDGELDRAYVADTGGRVFRVEFTRGRRAARLADVVTVATLGGVAAADRRFYAEPDVALVRRGPGAPYAAITLGSGFAPDPLAGTAADRLYSLRDALPGAPPPGGVAARGPIMDAELADVAAGSPAPASRGWKRRLAGRGERIVATARTIDHRVHVPTWTPPAAAVGADCTRPEGSARLLVLDVRDARPLAHGVIPAPPEPDALALPTGDVVPPLAVMRVPRDPTCGAACSTAVVGLVGATPVPVDWPGAAIRAGWAERGVE